MSVIIKGMKMPTSCKDCELLQDYDGDMYCPINDYLNFGDMENVTDYVMNGCLLVELPEKHGCEYYALCRHGRDENKLRARLGFCEYCNEDSDGYVKPVEKNGHAFIRFGINGWELSLKANGWHGDAKIRYCPMCGRDLLVK